MAVDLPYCLPPIRSANRCWMYDSVINCGDVPEVFRRAAGRKSSPASAISLRGKVFNCDNVDGVPGCDLSVFVQNRKTMSSDQNKFRMRHCVLASVGSAQQKRAKSPAQPLPNTIHSHAETLRIVRTGVNVAGNAFQSLRAR